jgi:nuclear pore complex protein Nup155
MYLSCDQQTQDTISRLTFANLITTKQGRDVARALLNAVINQQLSYQIGVSICHAGA